jgi:hypothetical protein
MAHGRLIIGLNEKAAQQKAQMVNQRRSQALKWLARQDDQKKKPPIGAKDK